MDLMPQVIALTDYFRLPLSIEKGAHRHKEWHHFCVVHPAIQAIVNLSLMRDAGNEAGWTARLIALVKDESGWDGEVDTIPSRDVRARRGKLDLTFGHNTLLYQDGRYNLSLALESRPITLQLQFQPASYPLMRRNTPIASGRINWVVVPRLLATGTIVVGRRVHRLDNMPAYHDHNWGSWSWGEDFSWQWGYAVPQQIESPWSVVFDRMTNRGRNAVLELKLSLWKNQKLHRLYMQDEIGIQQSGFVTQTRQGGSAGDARLAKFPRPMALLAPERATDVPRRFEITAERGSDRLACRFMADDVAQIILPNDTDLGVTIINEVSGVMSVEGAVSGEAVFMEGRGFFEFLT